MNYHFTFKTNEDLRKAERNGFDDTFDIVRVSFKYPNDNATHDIPLKTEEEYNDFLVNRIPNQKLNVEKFYQDKHGFDLGKLDYLNENKKTMKNKMTISELKQYVISEAKKLYKIEVLKEERERIEKELSILSEKKYSDKASKVIGKEISHLQKDKGYPHDRAVAAAINVAKEKGFKIPAPKNENTPDPQMPPMVGNKKNESKSPSSGLTKKEKSDVVKKAKAGEDIGHKGKGFEDVAAKAAKEYGSKEKGEKVAAAAMWKNIKRH